MRYALALAFVLTFPAACFAAESAQSPPITTEANKAPALTKEQQTAKLREQVTKNCSGFESLSDEDLARALAAVSEPTFLAIVRMQEGAMRLYCTLAREQLKRLEAKN